jgi:hypothetical protein
MLWQSASGVGRHAVSGQVTGTGGEFIARRTNLAGEWDQMVFAEAGDVNLANEDHFVMVLCEDSIIDHV